LYFVKSALSNFKTCSELENRPNNSVLVSSVLEFDLTTVLLTSCAVVENFSFELERKDARPHDLWKTMSNLFIPRAK
jgi:hypothetical protein